MKMNLGFVNNNVKLIIMKKAERRIIIIIILMQQEGAMLKDLEEKGIRTDFRTTKITMIQVQGIISKIFINNKRKGKKEEKFRKNESTK